MKSATNFTMIFWEDGSEVVIIDPDEEDDLEMEGIPYV